MIYTQLYMEIDHIHGQAETANCELQVLTLLALLVQKYKH
jgi:hypothetical protein